LEEKEKRKQNKNYNFRKFEIKKKNEFERESYERLIINLLSSHLSLRQKNRIWNPWKG
jgi:hypothetical protein